MNNEEYRDYMRGINGQNPLSPHGQAGVAHRKHDEAIHSLLRDVNLNSSYSKSINPRKSEIHGTDNKFESPITDAFRDVIDDFLSSRIGKIIRIFLYILSLKLSLIYFNYDSSLKWENIFLSLIVGLIAPPLLSMLFFKILSIIEIIFTIVIKLAILIAFAAGLFWAIAHLF